MKPVMVTLAALLSGCGLLPEKVSYDDARVQPLWKAVEAVDRTALGFTPVSKTADIRLERSRGAYDAMLHIYSTTSRTIAFREAAGGYRWIGEQETHRGPKKYKTVDGTFEEEIVVTYDTEKISGAPLNQVSIRYHGEDPNLANRDLTLAYVRPIMAEWDALKQKQ
jgi:hypothetical protein